MLPIDDFIRALVTAIANASLYSREHPQIIRQVALATDRLSTLLDDRSEIVILQVEERLVVDGSPLPPSLSLDRLMQFMKSRGIEHLRFHRGTTREEVTELTFWFAAPDDAPFPSLPHVGVGTVDLLMSTADTPEALGELHRRIPELSQIPAEEIARFLDMYQEVRQHKSLTISGISEIVTGFIASFRNVSGSFLALAPLRALDEYSFTHSTTVCALNLAQGMALGHSGQMLHDLGVAGMLHDIGKLFLPEEILTKSESLTPQEWELVRQHPVKGARYLLTTPGVPRIAVVTAFEHHMQYDQSGYPDVAPGWRQSLSSLITAISDVYDALRTRRSYRAPLETDRIVAILEGLKGTKLHPLLTENFISLLRMLERGESA